MQIEKPGQTIDVKLGEEESLSTITVKSNNKQTK